ncbi:MAG: patatin-like phospholipase family protein, partial [Rhodothermales bacterium]
MDVDRIDHPRPFTLVLAGGGARGFSHAGVLRALEHEGLVPDAIVGVSMGSVIGVTYSLRLDWYEAVLSMKTSAFPPPFQSSSNVRRGILESARGFAYRCRVLWDMVFGWGPGARALEPGRAALKELTGPWD